VLAGHDSEAFRVSLLRIAFFVLIVFQVSDQNPSDLVPLSLTISR
jgi:hypothetical protein